MKKIIVTLAIALTTLSSFAGEEKVNTKVLDAFKTEFNAATEVEWTVGTDFYRAAFVYNQQHVFAYYNTEGELLGLTRYISPVDLPILLQAGLKKNYKDYWISDLFEVAKISGTSYYITIENADTKIVLKSNGGNEWSVHEKTKKA